MATHATDLPRQHTPATRSSLASGDSRHISETLLGTAVDVLAREALASLTISHGQMATILGMERSQFRPWITGRVVLPDRADRLRMLVALLSQSGITSQRPLPAHLLNIPLAPGAPPLIEQLAGDLSCATVASHVGLAAATNALITHESEMRTAHMRVQGHHPGSEEDSAASLDQTITMMEMDAH